MEMDGAPTLPPGPAVVAAPRRGRWAWVAAGLLALAAGGAAFWWWPRPPAPVAVAPGQDEEPDDPVPGNPGYVGAQACAACHARRSAEFGQTIHPRACRVARPGEMPAGFAPGRGSHSAPEAGVRFEMTEAGPDFALEAVRRTPAGEERSRAPINLVYGANKADEVFFSWHGDRLSELPVVWLHPFDRWAHTTLNRHGGGDFSREATTRCLECHNTYFDHVPGTANRYKPESFLLGVTCERCHGPGREHVDYHRARPREEAAHAIVHPGRLGRERQLEVCTQCHGNATRDRGRPFTYRPGEPLEASVRLAHSRHPEQDHVANQVKYLRESKCFRKSEMTCTTCHDPHRPHDPADANSARNSCAKCHRPADCREQPRLPTAARGDCVGCHMPQRVWMNVHFHTEDDRYVPPVRRYDHHIAVNPVARQEVLLVWLRGRPDAESRKEAERLTKSLADHWLAEAERRKRDYRFLAAIGAYREALRVDPAAATRQRLAEAVATQARVDDGLATGLHQAEQRQFPEAIESLRKVLALKPDLAVAHGKLGTLLAMAGRREEAEGHLRAVTEYDPDDAYGESMLGWMAYLRGDAAGAVAAYRRAQKIEPFDAPVDYRLGLSLLKLGKPAEALEAFRQALAADPNHAGACQGLSHALRQQGRPAEAVRYARKAARLSGFENADVLITLADAYADAGRWAEARDTASRILELAQARAPETVPEARRRLESFRARAERPSN